MSWRVSRAEAWDLLAAWVRSASLRRHCLAVEASMVAYARRSGADEEAWAVCGLLHDADFERHPDTHDEVDGHPRTIMRELSQRGAPEELVDAIAGHATYLGVPRVTDMAKTLYAVDELSGFVLACAAVRPEGIHGMTPKSVKKKLKTPAFAAAINREEVRIGAEELGVEFDEHIAVVIGALADRADLLELHGAARPDPA